MWPTRLRSGRSQSTLYASLTHTLASAHCALFQLYDLNVNSVIVYPEHEQWIDDPLSKNNADALKVRGYAAERCAGMVYGDSPTRRYAYCGGGRRITRVELTMDNGATWMPADVSYPPVRVCFLLCVLSHSFYLYHLPDAGGRRPSEQASMDVVPLADEHPCLEAAPRQRDRGARIRRGTQHAARKHHLVRPCRDG